MVGILPAIGRQLNISVQVRLSQANDATTLATGCAVLATSLPVRRATRLDPAVVLRDQ